MGAVLNKVKITLLGSEITVNTGDDADYVKQLGDYCNSRLQKNAERGGLPPLTAALVTMLQCCDDIKKLEQKAEKLEKENKRLLERQQLQEKEVAELVALKQTAQNEILSLSAQNRELLAAVQKEKARQG